MINWGEFALKNLMRGRLIPARVIHLEMVKPVMVVAPQPEGRQMVIMQVKNCPTHFYRYIYDRVGRKHHWGQRLRLPDDLLSAILCSPKSVLHVLYLDGAPAGFCEMSLENWPDLEIVYFGLMGEFQGRGWGRFFFSQMIDEAWSRQPERLIIQTNTLDSPHALRLYRDF